MDEEEFEKELNNMFGGISFSKMLGTNVPTKKLPKDLAKLQEYANRLAFEDQVEREAKQYGLSHVIISPDTQNAGKFLIWCYIKRNAVAPSGFSSLMSGGESRPVMYKGSYSLFEQADAWMEKNKYFGLKNTKFYEGIFASWD
jgi:hypothetical protein